MMGRKNWKRRIAFVLAFFITASSSVNVSAMELNPAEVNYAEGGSGEGEYAIPPLTYQDVEDSVDSVMDDPDYMGPVYSSLESKYDPLEKGINLPAIRNQNPYGSCWAHSSVGMGEMAYYKENPNETDMELSELHLAYFVYNGGVITDPLGGLEGDYNKNIGSNFLNRGGNLAFSGSVLACWIGAAAEETAPYSGAADALTNGLDPEIAFTDRMHLQGIRKINMKTDTDLAKQMVKQYGAVGISYYEDQSSYNSTNNCYYQNTKTTTNHAVMIVGWDDDFSKEYFNSSKQPSSNGAWLIRNSWGGSSTDYSHYSYFWMSYEDTSINETGYVFLYEDQNSPDYYDNNYQYDGAMWSSSYSYGNKVIAANVFNVKANASGEEKLRAVSFDTDSVNVDYTIQIYTDLTNSSDPESGTLVSEATTTGITTTAGYYTVPLDSDVILTNGTTFSVVVTLEKESADYVYVSLEYNGSADWFSSVASAKEGQSFVKSGNYWYDYGKNNNRNIRIKAFTDNYTSVNPVTSITLNKTSLELNKGDSFTLKPTMTPSDHDSVISWTSSNSSAATVDQDGNITAAGAGTAVITVSAGNISASCLVTVKAPATAISLGQTSASITEGDTLKLTATVSPTDCTDNITWNSSNTNVATVDDSGLVTAKSAGTAIITVSAGSQQAQCSVTVAAKYIPAKSITLNTYSANLSRGESFTLKATVAPGNYSLGKVQWRSTDEAVAIVDASGNVSAKGAGEADIVASADDVSVSCFVKVTVPAESIELEGQTSASITEGDTLKLTATVSPTDCTDNITWNSSNINVATVDDYGLVTAKSAGTAIITVSAGSQQARCSVTVAAKYIPAESIELDCTAATVYTNENIGLNVSVYPSDTTDTVNWNSLNPSIATVNDNGMVTGIRPGTTTIYAQAGDLLTECVITVSDRYISAQSITLNRSSLELVEGNGDTLTATVSPYNYSSGKVSWSSSDPAVVSVDQNGKVFANGVGTAIITAYADNISQTCTITVNNTPGTSSFTDVKKGAFYEAPVTWAVQKGITTGTSATTFAPDDYCSRGQIVTFLWRAAGCPEPISTYNPFTDISAGKYYYKAVLWAVEQGITTGIGTATFAPDAICTRAQSVTFLHRYAGKPAGNSAANPFTDVDAGTYYFQPVLWAMEQGITTGTSATTFEPNNYCTRGQIVTFLYRQMN